MDSWDAMITREELGIRDELIEVLEQCEIETLQQIDGTCLEKATIDLTKSWVCLNPCSNLITSQPHSDQNSITLSPMSPYKISWAKPFSPQTSPKKRKHIHTNTTPLLSPRHFSPHRKKSFKA